MVHRIARPFAPLLELLFPGTGRRRLANAARTGPPPAPSHAPKPTGHRPGSRPLHGEDHTLVRPYLVAHERREEARRRQARRRTLRLAVHGVHVAPAAIHRAEVPA
ncbi:hypothetical protein [Streptomyces shenzhenensis]|uniref:hypothetical protein n=1 Tax=Streptomyces shenzhenensis TaxID=943815 RepID=UPI001F1E7DFC|nr:hypothetical protein [Streptomyces shenzhenensis]